MPAIVTSLVNWIFCHITNEINGWLEGEGGREREGEGEGERGREREGGRERGREREREREQERENGREDNQGNTHYTHADVHVQQLANRGLLVRLVWSD